MLAKLSKKFTSLLIAVNSLRRFVQRPVRVLFLKYRLNMHLIVVVLSIISRRSVAVINCFVRFLNILNKKFEIEAIRDFAGIVRDGFS